MNKHLSEVLLFFFLVLSMGNGVKNADERSAYFRVPTQTIEPINEAKTNLYRSLDIQAIHGCFLRFTLLLLNDNLKGVLIDNSGDPLQRNTEGYVLISPQQQEISLIAGQSITLHWTYPSRYLLDRNSIQLKVDVYGSRTSSDYLGVILGFPVSVFHPNDWSFQNSGTLQRDPLFGCYFRYPDTAGMNAWSTDYQNCAGYYENPEQNAVPLAQACFRSRDYDGLAQRFAFREAYLCLNNDEGDYQIGEVHYDAHSRWRIFPLVLGPTLNNGSFSSFHLAEEYAVSIDGRTMKKASKKTERDILTHTLYLPPVKTGERKSFSFTLVVKGAGEVRQDSFHWAFAIDKDKNYFGSFPNSDYAVEVI